MAERLNVNPTRMELTKLKNSLTTARRGHKLLKDKRDELMKQFLELMRQNRVLRRRTEEALAQVHGGFSAASALMSPELLEQALMYPKQRASVEVSTRNLMSVNVPRYSFQTQGTAQDILPCGYAATSGELDDALAALASVMTDLLELAQVEKAVQLLAGEIERTRRRVNALEHVMIPRQEATIRYITMKLDENERGNLTRLMKVKDMMVKQAIEARATAEA